MQYGYTWGEHLHNPYESLWSLINKFAALNVIKYGDIYRIFGIARAQGCTPQVFVSFNAFNRFDQGLISKILNIHDVELNYSIIAPYSVDVGFFKFCIEQDTSKFLRVCPECIKVGFHTPLYQFIHIRRCPIHNCTLIDKCKRCNFRDYYTVNKASLAFPYACSRCHTPLYETFSNDVCHVSERKKIIREIFEGYFDWKLGLENRLKLNQNQVLHMALPFGQEYPWECTVVSDTNFKKQYFTMINYQSIPGWPKNGVKFIANKNHEFIQLRIPSPESQTKEPLGAMRAFVKLNNIDAILTLSRCLFNRVKNHIFNHICKGECKKRTFGSIPFVIPCCAYAYGFSRWKKLYTDLFFEEGSLNKLFYSGIIVHRARQIKNISQRLVKRIQSILLPTIDPATLHALISRVIQNLFIHQLLETYSIISRICRNNWRIPDLDNYKFEKLIGIYVPSHIGGIKFMFI